MCPTRTWADEVGGVGRAFLVCINVVIGATCSLPGDVGDVILLVNDASEKVILSEMLGVCVLPVAAASVAGVYNASQSPWDISTGT